MIFLRSHQPPVQRSLAFVRAAAVTALAAYPLGTLTLALAPDSLATSLAGYALVLVSLVAAGLLTGTSVQRIVAEDASVLDEHELQLRRRAMSAAYTAMSVLALLAILYAAIASNAGAWVPSGHDAFNGLFWGAFLYCFTLPTACLAWLVDDAPGLGDA